MQKSNTENQITHSSLSAFVAEIEALRQELRAQAGEEDLRHLRKMERWGRLSTAMGLLTAWIAPNPVSAALLSLGTFARWTMLGHHIRHRGYDKVPGVPARYTSAIFARGARRFIDWFDWLLPEAWEYEHNQLHHYHLGEDGDPDLVERNLAWLRQLKAQRFTKRLLIYVMACFWKWIYYAPNTLAELQRAEARRRGSTVSTVPTGLFDSDTWSPLAPFGRKLWRLCLLPYLLWNFVAIPLMFLPLGPTATMSVLINQLLAEVLTNLHAFAVIVSNHAGDDLVRFDGPISSREEFFFRQAASSVNFDLGSDAIDFLHGFANYQIEHHLLPDLTMRQYQKAQPRVEALCRKYGIPYLREPVWKRLPKAIDIMIGAASMKRGATQRSEATEQSSEAVSGPGLGGV